MIIGATNFDSYIQLFVVLIIFILVLVLTYFTTRFIGGYQKSQMNNKNIKIVESLRVGNNKFIALIEIGNVYLVVGIGKDEVNTIAKLTKDELPDILTNNGESSTSNNATFKSILENFKNKKG